jgi:DNA-binding Lrp family transcriptional regulator
MTALDETDRAVINGLQGGFPLTTTPWADAGRDLGLTEAELLARVGRLVETGALSRFGPLWNVERLGGAVCLAAMAVPPDRFEAVADQVNAHREIAHNYERTHRLNMWFVISTATPDGIASVARQIEDETGLAVHLMPKEREFFIGFRVEV